MDQTQDSSNLVIPFENSVDHLGSSRVADYIFRYLDEQGAKICIIEEKYVDRDFLLDYSKYYARSFNNGDERFTKRLHFFKCQLTNEEFEQVLIDGTDDKIELLKGNYLGFTVVKPICDQDDEPLIGRTILATYPEEDGNSKRVFVRDNYRVSLFGIELKVKSLPFQTQDSIVGGCATIACWITLHALSKRFGTPVFSPYEVTERSVSYSSLNRDFPSHGLRPPELKNLFIRLGLDTEFIVPSYIQTSSFSPPYDDITADLVKAYINMGVPVITAIALKKPKTSRKFRYRLHRFIRREKEEADFDAHAVVISGYRHDNGKVTELYLHDDRIGPYCRTVPITNFSMWHNEWISVRGYEGIFPYLFLVPVYPKIRVEFPTIYQAYQAAKNDLYAKIDPKYHDKYRLELVLADVKNYKKELLKKQFKDKSTFLQKPMARFLWVIRSYYDDELTFDFVNDATDERGICQMEMVDYTP